METKKIRVQWLGDPPETCDLCGARLRKEFIDGKTIVGPWGNMCPGCHRTHGVGLGTGKGQRYQLQASGAWEKVEG